MIVVANADRRRRWASQAVAKSAPISPIIPLGPKEGTLLIPPQIIVPQLSPHIGHSPWSVIDISILR